MPIYDYRCGSGHRFERLVPFADASAQLCPACGVEAAKVPSRVALGGVAATGRAMEMMPQTWRGTHDGNREYVHQLRREWETRQKLEDKHPELQGDRRPILAHEGRYENAPLRLGDPVPGAPAAADAPSAGHSHGHGHGHSHGHGHGHSHGPSAPTPGKTTSGKTTGTSGGTSGGTTSGGTTA